MLSRITPTILLVTLSGILWTPPATASDRWTSDVEAAIERAEETDRMLLVDLYADWCGWCKVLERKVFATPEFQRFAERFVLLRVDTEDGAEGTLLKARYRVSSLPTTLILDADMVQAGAVTGFKPPAEFIAAVETELAKYRTLVEFFDRVRESDEVDLQHRLAEDFHDRGDGRRAAALYERVLERVEEGTAAYAWLRYQAADARRLAGELDVAESHLKRALKLAATLGDPELLERLDLLSFHLAQDRGDCQAATASLEHFLEEHPKSVYSGQARRTLEELRHGGGALCT
jgi:thiol-disulfide isomerase/thioredoxin